MAKVILVDIDGVLAMGEAWTPEECLKAKPNLKVIEKLRNLHLTGFIVIYTARRDCLIPVTLEWLRRNNVPFHAFSNNKTPCDLLIDDKAVNINDFK